MQMIMMVFRSSLEGEVLHLVEQEQMPFTRLDSTQGKGTTGTVSGSSLTVSGMDTVLLLAVSDERLTGFRQRVHQFYNGLKAHAVDGSVPLISLSCHVSSGFSPGPSMQILPEALSPVRP